MNEKKIDLGYPAYPNWGIARERNGIDVVYIAGLSEEEADFVLALTSERDKAVRALMIIADGLQMTAADVAKAALVSLGADKATQGRTGKETE